MIFERMFDTKLRSGLISTHQLSCMLLLMHLKYVYCTGTRKKPRDAASSTMACRIGNKFLNLATNDTYILDNCEISNIRNYFTLTTQTYFKTLSIMTEAAEELHLLQNTWVISEQYQQEEKADKARDYESSFEKICSFNTIEDFWGYWNKLPRISYS